MMYIFRVSLFLLIVFGTLSPNTFAQANLLNEQDISSVNINNYSDKELLDFYQRAQAAGFKKDQVYIFLAEKGMPDAEITKLKSRLERLVKYPQRSSLVYSNEAVSPESRYDTNISDIPLIHYKGDPSIFGSELFTSGSLNFEPNLRIPPPPNYMLGPDDELIISVYGLSEKKYELRINELGQIYIPHMGPILVSGYTLEQATEKIKNKLAQTIYSAIRTGQTKVAVTLGKIRSIRVTVIGQAKKPGNYTVSSLTTLYNLLFLSGGPTDLGSYRQIEVIRGKERKIADLYEFLVYGNQEDNLLLQEGDVIRIPYYQNRVTITGNIKRSGKFEMLDSEKFLDLLNFSGGFTDMAYRGAVTVIRITDSTRKIVDLPSSEYAGFDIRGSDKFIIKEIQDEFGNRIYVTGSVQRPGPYQLTPGLTVEHLLAKAGGLTVDAYTQRASLYRYGTNKLPEIESLNLDSVLNKNQTIVLKKNDSLVVNSIFYYHDKNYVTIEGEVRNPGRVLWRKNMTLGDVLFATGSVTQAGDSATIEISRRITNANVVRLNHRESIVLHVNLFTDSARSIFLEPFDIIMVKRKPGFIRQRTVLVRGEIKRPGKYALETSNFRISDIIPRTGGFKASADSSAITIRRIANSNYSIEERNVIFKRILNNSEDSLNAHPELREEIYKDYDLIKVDLHNALHNPSGNENLTLEDGDILTVHRASDLVKVSGEVYFPTIVPFTPGKNLKYYVEQAGDFMPQARKTGALVIQPDGKIKTVKHFLWFKFYPGVHSGSEIFIPRKQIDNRPKVSTAEWALIISALGIVGNVIINATN